jgi:hypothetical protein
LPGQANRADCFLLPACKKKPNRYGWAFLRAVLWLGLLLFALSHLPKLDIVIKDLLFDGFPLGGPVSRYWLRWVVEILLALFQVNRFARIWHTHWENLLWVDIEL